MTQLGDSGQARIDWGSRIREHGMPTRRRLPVHYMSNCVIIREEKARRKRIGRQGDPVT